MSSSLRAGYEAQERFEKELEKAKQGNAQEPWAVETSSPVDPVNHPPHYTSHPSGIECIQVSEWFPANIAQAIQYLWRHEYKDGDQDLDKAIWFIQREKNRRMRMREKGMWK